MRLEGEVFADLSALCVAPGYIHALAYLCYRDSIIPYREDGELTAKDMEHTFSDSHLVRTETNTLIGLMLKSPIDFTPQTSEITRQYADRTEALLEELHYTMTADIFAGLTPEKINEGFNPFESAEALREPIFYGGESAYYFQYRDLMPIKYKDDDSWIQKNKGFSLDAMFRLARAIMPLQNDKATGLFDQLKAKSENIDFLSVCQLSTAELSAKSGVDEATARIVLDEFAVDGGQNDKFNSINDFNIVSAKPLVRQGADQYLLFHSYSICEAMYEAPFYWMAGDKGHAPAAADHRGAFVEEFCRERLAKVFGTANVFENVKIQDSKRVLGEIDVLVLFGNRAIVLQGKAKRLTLEARRGNDLRIREDFSKAIQESYEQGFLCAELLERPDVDLVDGNGTKLSIPSALKVIYLLCVISDHYPALSFQARQFLKCKVTDKTPAPFVLDVFTLDAMTEMLETPLRLLSYIDRRSKYGDKFMASNELVILSFHLRRNLWIEGDIDMITLHDDVASDLDIAMIARREGIAGRKTPDGILTRVAGTAVGRIISQIENSPNANVLDLGLMLLTMGEETVNNISQGIDRVVTMTRKQGGNHDITVCGIEECGLTIHCNDDPLEVAGPRLERHCELRKYTEHADSWYGACLSPTDESLRFGGNLQYKWESSPELDKATAGLPRPRKLSKVVGEQLPRSAKTGRNDPCPCGSGRKYKRCHGS